MTQNCERCGLPSAASLQDSDFQQEGPMKRIVFLLSLILAFFGLYPAASAQDAPPVCEFNMVGTWQLTTEGQANPTLLRFKPNGIVTVLSPNTGGAPGTEWQATDWSK